MKKLISLLMAVILSASLAVPAAAADSAKAGTMRLESTEGTVAVKNASGLSVKLKDKMRLYDGYTVKTEAASYAYISLDGSKTLKLDASSEASVSKSGKKLEITLVSGSLFFNVTKPLESGEKLNIRTSTMVTGVRGTSACISAPDRDRTDVTLLTGRLEIRGSGGTEGTDLNAGERVTVTQWDAGAAQEGLEMRKTPAMEQELPGFAAIEVAKDPELQSRIAAETELSVSLIIRDAAEHLAADEAAARQEAAEVRQQLTRQEQQKTVDAVFKPAEDGSDREDPKDDEPGWIPSKPEPGPVVNLDNPTLEELRAALASSTAKVINLKNAAISLDSALDVPAGKTLNLNSGSLANSGTLTVSGSLLADSGAVLDNSGTLAVDRGSTLTVGSSGRLTNSGTLTVSGTATVNEGAALDNQYQMYVLGSSGLHVWGSISIGELHVGREGTPGLVEIGEAAAIAGDGLATVSPGSTFRMSEAACAEQEVMGAVAEGGWYTCVNSGSADIAIRVHRLYTLAFDTGNACGYTVGSLPAKVYSGQQVTVTVAPQNDALDLSGAELSVNDNEHSTAVNLEAAADGTYTCGMYLPAPASDGSGYKLALKDVRWNFTDAASATGTLVAGALSDSAVTSVAVGAWEAGEAIDQPTTVHEGQILTLCENSDTSVGNTLTVSGSLTVESGAGLGVGGGSTPGFVEITETGMLTLKENAAMTVSLSESILTVSGTMTAAAGASLYAGYGNTPGHIEVTGTGRLDFSDSSVMQLSFDSTLTVCGTVTMRNGSALNVGGDDGSGTASTGEVEITGNATVRLDNASELVVLPGSALTVSGTLEVADSGSALTNEGVISVPGGSFLVRGTLENYGKLNAGADGDPAVVEISGLLIGGVDENSLISVFSGNTIRLTGTLDTPTTIILWPGAAISWNSTGAGTLEITQDGMKLDAAEADGIYSYVNDGPAEMTVQAQFAAA